MLCYVMLCYGMVQDDMVWCGMHIIVRRIQGTEIRTRNANSGYDMYPSALRALESLGLLSSLFSLSLAVWT